MLSQRLPYFSEFPKRPIARYKGRRYIRPNRTRIGGIMKSAVIRPLCFTAIVVALAALFAACGGDSTTSPPTKTFDGKNIRIVDDAFSPSSATINVGDSLTWHWEGSHDHSVTEGTTLGGAHAFDSGIKTSGTFGHRFNTAGTVHYFCQVHFSSMKGTIVVKP
jgi:plastocyanin